MIEELSVCRSKKSPRVPKLFSDYPEFESHPLKSSDRLRRLQPALCPLLYHATVLSRLAHRLAEVVLLPDSACEGGVSHIYLVPSHNCACTFPRPASLLVLAEVRELLRVNSASADRTAHHRQTRIESQNPIPSTLTIHVPRESMRRESGLPLASDEVHDGDRVPEAVLNQSQRHQHRSPPQPC